MTEKVVHLIVQSGADAGKEITVPLDGARVGRSSKNDVVMLDPLLSRHHCRFFFKTGDGLWVADLGSANQTLVASKPITEMRVHVNDLITIGDTVMKVVNDGGPSAGSTSALPLPPVILPEQPVRPKSPVVDLGLHPEEKPSTRSSSPVRQIGTKPLLIVAGVVTLLAVLSWVPKFLRKHSLPGSGKPNVQVVQQPVNDAILEIDYERVEASLENIFRYKLSIGRNNMIAVQIDDIKNNRHVRREKVVDEEYCQSPAQTIRDSGFFDLSEKYEGIQPNVHDAYDLRVTIGRKTHRTRVENRTEPDDFKAVRERIEESGKNELGLVAIQYTAEKLTEMSKEAFLLGSKLYDEREIKYSNLFSALTSSQEAEWYMETVEPKPDFYKKIVANITDCKRELDKKYQDQNLLAQRAIKMGEWEQAAKELRTIMEMIPDRSDPRHADARKSLIDAQSHLEQKK